MGWRRARALRNMLWEESAGVATLLAQMDLREGQHLGQQSPEVLSWHSVGPCVQSLELRCVDSSHTSVWALMLRGRFVSLEKGEFTRHPVT